MGNHLDAEVEIAKEIRNTCDGSGAELKLEKSAPLLQKLALVYLDKSPDEVSLLQSVGLLNAALLRQPNDDEIKEELNKACFHILEVANVRNRKINLLNISQQVVIKIRAMRNATNAAIANLTLIPYNTPYAKVKEMEKRKIKEIEVLQSQVTKQYKDILRYISRKCIKINGSPPCEFALVGLGSLARKTITPYSGFKTIVVLKEGTQNSNKYMKILRYFRWYLTIFQVIILNLQETALEKVEVPVLNNPFVRGANWFNDQHTLSGISVDGMMSYAWITPSRDFQDQEDKSFVYETIKPVMEMIKLLSKEENLKDGYHLADVSFSHCFLAGHKRVYLNFAKAVRETIVEGRRSHKYSTFLHQKICDEFKSFQVENYICLSSNYVRPNVRHSLKHSLPFFVSTVARLKLVDKPSLFETARALRELDFITEEAAREIVFALAVSIEAKLRESMDREFQEGARSLIRYGNVNDPLISKLVELLGEHNMTRYFEIVILLQRLTAIKTFEKWNIDMPQKAYAKFHLFILNFLNLHELVPTAYQQFLSKVPNGQQEEKLLLHAQMTDTYFNIRQYQKALDITEKVLSEYPEPVCQKHFIYTHKGRCLYRLKNYEEALILLSRTDAFRSLNKSKIYKTPCFDPNITDILIFVGLSHLHLGNFKESLKFLSKALAYLNFYDNFALLKCDCKSNMANCFLGLGEIERAKKKTNQALKLYQDMNAPILRICNCHHTLGLCYMQEERYKEALDHLRTDFTLRSRLVKNESNPNHLESALALLQLAASKLHEEEDDDESDED